MISNNNNSSIKTRQRHGDRARIGVTQLAFIGGSVFLLWTQAICPAATFHPIGDLPGGPFRSSLQGISGDGSTAVGFSPAVQGRASTVRWTVENGLEAIGPVPSTFSWGLATSHDGSVIVGQRDSLPVVWTELVGFQNFSDAGITHGNFWGVSGDGSTAVGFFQYSNGDGEAIRWSEGRGLTNLGYSGFGVDASFDGSVIAGGVTMDGQAHAIRWTGETGAVMLGDLRTNGFEHSRASSITPDGTAVVGGASTDSGLTHPFLWTVEGGMVDLAAGGAFESRESSAAGLSADASIVVGSIGNPFGSVFDAFVWTQTTGMVSMKAWLTDEHGLGEDLAGWRLTDAAGISDDGLTIAGNGVNPQGNDEGWVVKLAPFSLPGDYNNNGIVEQADLDLVLLHWGADAADVPDDWSGDLPIGIVDQDELDGVLLSWGGGATRTVGAVPEPQSLLLTLVILGAVWIGKKVRLDRQWG